MPPSFGRTKTPRAEKGGPTQSSGPFSRGVSTKIHAVTTTEGKPLHVTLTQGHRHEALKAEELCIADSGYSSDAIVEAIRARGMKPVIAPNPTHRPKLRLDRKLYALRYRIECGFHALKRFRAVATRYEKSGTNFLATVHVACIWMWLCN
jgi:transposase